MNLALGIKTDPIEYRYSYEWLFALMRDLRVPYAQLGSSFEFYHVEDSYFTDLRRTAERFGVRIKSCFTAHRELGGFFLNDARLAAVALRNLRRWIQIGGLLGADYVGSNPGAVFRDLSDTKESGILRYLDGLRAVMKDALAAGLLGVTIEPMSSIAEPPSLPEEIVRFAQFADHAHHDSRDSTAPAYFCGDISHAVVDSRGEVLFDHLELFELELPWMAEFHFKNTDARYHSTFGFGEVDRERGVVHLAELRALLDRHADDVPVEEFVGYLEIGGPKLGRDYSDPLLRGELETSIAAIRDVFPEL